MNLNDLQLDLNTSLKAGDSVRVGTLRQFVSAIRNSAIALYGASWESSLKESDIIDVAKKQVKTHKESILAFTQAKRDDLVQKETAELVILEEFTPKEMSDDELKTLLAPIASIDEKNFGLLMKTAMAAVQGKADGGRVLQMLRQLVSSK